MPAPRPPFPGRSFPGAGLARRIVLGASIAAEFAACHAKRSPAGDDGGVTGDAPSATPALLPGEPKAPVSTLPSARAGSSATAPDDEALATSPSSSSGAPPPLDPSTPPVVYPPIRRNPLTAEQLARMVTAAPQLARVGADVSLFDPGDGSYAARSKADRDGISFTTAPVLWSPAAGVELLVATGRGKASSFVAAWWPLPGGQYRLASSFVMLGEVAPVALAYRPGERSLWWTTCWKCPGEMGHLSLREDHRVVIVQE